MKTTASLRKTQTFHWSLTELVRDTFRGFRADRGIDLAGSLAFTSLLTAVPLVAAFSIFLATFFRENDDQVLAILNALLPYQSTHLTQNIREFIAESTAISGVGLALAVIVSVRLIFVVEGVFNAVWGAPRRRMSVARVVLYTFALFALGGILGGIGWALRAMRHSVDVDSGVKAALLGLTPFALKALLLTLLFRYLPNARVHLLAAGVAGAAVALGLELLRLAFGVYVEAMFRMNLITGSLAFAFLVILSLFLAWVLILAGVELTHVLQTHVARAAGGLVGQGRAERAIRMLLRMSSATPSPVAEIQPDPEAPPAETIAILEDLKRAGLVAGDETAGFQLARSSREITISAVVDGLSPDLLRVSPHQEDRVALVLEPLFFRMEYERRVLLGTTLAELRRKA